MNPSQPVPLADTWRSLAAQARELSARARARTYDRVEAIVRDAEEYGVPGDQLVGRVATGR